MINQNENSSGKYINGTVKMLKCLAAAYIFTIIILFVFALIITYTGVGEAVGEIAAKAVTYISAALCGFLCASRTNERGWLTGSLAGLAYIALPVVLNLFTNGAEFYAGMLISVFGAVLAGLIGGIAGINFKRQ